MDHDFEEAAAEFAKFIASHGMTLIFGGSNVGTMKTVADAALSAGGKVVGVFTTNLPMSLAHPGLTELVVTHSLAERKREMIERADALLAEHRLVGVRQRFHMRRAFLVDPGGEIRVPPRRPWFRVGRRRSFSTGLSARCLL